jgi:hypothetical protein
MNLDQAKQQQLTLLARKALLNDELKQIDVGLGQLAAIIQFAEANAPKPEPEVQA